VLQTTSQQLNFPEVLNASQKLLLHFAADNATTAPLLPLLRTARALVERASLRFLLHTREQQPAFAEVLLANIASTKCAPGGPSADRARSGASCDERSCNDDSGGDRGNDGGDNNNNRRRHMNCCSTAAT
jgi:hypothetical protein